MINEREGYFSNLHLDNRTYFPKIIIVRKAKQNSGGDSGSTGVTLIIKNIFKA